MNCVVIVLCFDTLIAHATCLEWCLRGIFQPSPSFIQIVFIGHLMFQFHVLVQKWPCLTSFIYRSVNSLFGAAMSWTIHQNLPSFLAGWLCTFVSYIMCSVFAALQQMGFRFSPEFVKFMISKCDLQNHKHMSVDQFIVTCVQIQRFTGKIEDVCCSLNIS